MVCTSADVVVAFVGSTSAGQEASPEPRLSVDTGCFVAGDRTIRAPVSARATPRSPRRVTHHPATRQRMHTLSGVPEDSLSSEEFEQLDGETASPAVIAGRLFASHPRLIPHAVSTAVRGAVTGAATAVKADPTLGWMADADQVRRISPGAILGATWGGLETFVTAFGEHVGKDQVALEVGCGGGRVTRRLQPLVAELHAVDVSQVILDQARTVAPQARFFTVAGFGDSLPDDRYDAVASHDVFVHFEFDECARYLYNIARTLRPKGVFVFSVYTLDGAAEHEEYRREISSSTRLAARRVRRFPSESYETLLDIFGFDVIDRRRAAREEYPRLSLALAGGGETPHLNFVARKM